MKSGEEPSSDRDAAKSDDQSAKAVTLVAMDGDTFVVNGADIAISQLLRVMVDGASDDGAHEIPIANIRGNVLAKIVEFCKHYSQEPMHEIPKPIRHGRTVADHVQEWYTSFIGGVEDEMLFELLLAANFLDLAPLLSICAATVGLRMMTWFVSDKTPDEIREEFNITEAFSTEVERKLSEENRWSTEPPVSH